MKASWFIAIAAGAAISATAPTELMAQGNSGRARQQQQQQQAREQSRRDAERAQLQRQREQQRQQAARATIRRDDDRNRRDDDRYRRDDRYDRYDDRYRRDDRDRRDYDRYNDRYDRRGPAFCRSGQGHPVHGRQWCRAKGYTLGNERARDIWGDIIFRDRRYDDRRYDDRRLGRGTLGDILGSVILGRFDEYGRTYYGNGAMTGQWLPDGRASVLQLYIGSLPFARLIDLNRDGRVDNVILLR
jgi:hypothetical protein